MSDEFYDEQWYADRWLSMLPVLRKIAADTIKRVISKEDFDLIRRKYDEYGPHVWIHHLIDIPAEEREKYVRVGMAGEGQTDYSGHHIFGTAIRNILRNDEHGAGIKDSDLPLAPYEDGSSHANWDDVYVQAIEAAAGLREV